MPNACWAPGCTSGYAKNTEKRHMFKAPNDATRLNEWRRLIPREGTLTSKHVLCDKHFDEQFIEKDYIHQINGQTVRVPRGKWTLKNNAVPTIFPSLPKYLSKAVPTPRKISKRKLISDLHILQKKRKVVAKADQISAECLPEADDEVNEPRNETEVQNVLLKNPKRLKSSTVYSQRELYVLRQNKLRLQAKIMELNRKVRQLEKENLKLKLVQGHFGCLPEKQKLILNQAVNVARAKTPNGRRYDAKWIMDCLLLRIKSSVMYNFLRDNEFLPLPCTSTLCKYIKNLSPNFGFQPELFGALKEKLLKLPPKERRGMLMFDEIQTSKHIDYRPHDGKLIGKVDYGELTTEAQKQQDGDHALVFLFRPHFGGWMQAIGSFCASGSTPATILAKLILQSIIHLHNSEALVDGLVADGASPNRSALTTLGWNGSKEKLQNSIQHPCDENRRIYIFCDGPHILKTVRNNAEKAKHLEVPEGVVDYTFYEKLLNVDLNLKTSLRAVPKLTKAHVHPDNFQKMSVGLAAQLFSNSVACGLELYQKTNPAVFKEVTATILFTRRMNNIFDLLNSRRPCDGIRLTNGKLEKLEEAFNWLNSWETHVESLPVERRRRYLSKQTSVGLRTTIKSTLDLCRDLLSEGFNYVLSGNFNQDLLERFFGMVRQGCGGDDHPNPNQFLYVYRLLSLNSLIKPPKRANIDYDNTNVLLGLNCNVEKAPFTLKTIEEQIDRLLETSPDDQQSLVHPDLENEHGYSMASSEENIFYYVSGYIAAKLSKHTSCEACAQNVKEQDIQCSAKSLFVELKTRGGLTHPSKPLQMLLNYLERCIQKYSEAIDANIFENIMNDVFSSEKVSELKLGCSEHKNSFTAKTIYYFVNVRLHFICRNQNTNRQCRQKKKQHSKLAKLT